jgi:hypothetical protein
MPDEIKQGQDWIEQMIRHSSSVDAEIQWAEDDDRGPPDASNLSKAKTFYRVVVVTPEGCRASERLASSDIEDCAHDHNADARQRVGQKILGMLRRIGIAM